LDDVEFCRTVFGQLDVNGLDVAVEADIVRRAHTSTSAAIPAHAETLDVDTEGPLKSIHRRVATAICFESAGGMDSQVARLPELRLAVGEPDLPTTSIDSAAFLVERESHFIHRSGVDGYRLSSRPKIDRLVNERRASLDYERDVRPELCRLIEKAFQPSDVPVAFFPGESSSVPDVPRLTLVVADPDDPWTGDSEQRNRLADLMRSRGASPRLYPGGLLWCFRRPGTSLRDRVEIALAWRIVMHELQSGIIGSEFEPDSLHEAPSKLDDAETLMREEVAGAYQTVVLADHSQSDPLRILEPGDRHDEAETSLSVAGHVLSTLREAALVSESISARFIQRVWPPAFQESGTWPLASLRQSFFDGSLTRLLDAEPSLKQCLSAGIASGDFGLAMGPHSDGSFDRVWHDEVCSVEEIRFESQCFLLTAERAAKLKSVDSSAVPSIPSPLSAGDSPGTTSDNGGRAIQVTGSIPPGQWNRIGTRLLAKLYSAGELRVDVSIRVECPDTATDELIADVRQTLDELGLADSVEVRRH